MGKGKESVQGKGTLCGEGERKVWEGGGFTFSSVALQYCGVVVFGNAPCSVVTGEPHPPNQLAPSLTITYDSTDIYLIIMFLAFCKEGEGWTGSERAASQPIPTSGSFGNHMCCYVLPTQS